MILQMSTRNRKLFREELARCCGPVSVVLPDGTQCDARTACLAEKAGSNAPAKLRLKIQQPGDYMRLACFAIGDL